MKVYPIFRGIDNEIEFKGLRGRYFYIAAVGVVGSVFLTLLLYIIGVPAVLAVLVLLVGIGTTLFYAFGHNKKYGRWGAVKQDIKNQKPPYVYQNRSFKNILSMKLPTKTNSKA